MGWFQQVGLKFLTNAYSQDREGEADELGVRLMKAAGYDAGAAERILEKLDRLKEGKDQSVLGEYLSTHPPVSRRIRSVRYAASS